MSDGWSRGRTCRVCDGLLQHHLTDRGICPAATTVHRLEAERDALRTAGERLCTELEYVWEAESHAARFRDAIDAWRAIAGEDE